METKYKVLVLDDERLVRFTISAYLKSADFTVSAAETAEEAVGLLKRERFQAVVSDVLMGEMDGFMFRDIVRKIDADIPIIFLTSMMNDTGNAFMERVMEDIHSYYVSKSAPRSVLIGKLEQVVQAYVAELNVRSLEKRLEKSLTLASFVQKAMLPPWVHVDSSYVYTSCFVPYQAVSGDLFEWFPVTDDTALFISGDISGHGTNAALAMTAVQAFLKQFGRIEDRQAQRVHKLARLIHDFLYANLHDVAYMVATVMYADFKTRRIRYINCGNPAPHVISRATGLRRKVNPERRGSLPLGLFEEAEYREEDVVEFECMPDEVVLATSDGVYDLSSDPEGNDSAPKDILHEIFCLATKAEDRDGDRGLFAAIPHRIMSALSDLGYVHKQDDISFFVLGANARMTNSFFTEVKMLPDLIDDICHAAGTWAGERYGEEIGVKVDLLCNEHFMNIYRHGYDDFGRQHEVGVLSMYERNGRLVVCVWDRGAPWADVAQQSMAEADAVLDARNASLSDEGRGRSIMRKIASQVQVERFVNLNKTVFYIDIQKDKEAVS